MKLTYDYRFSTLKAKSVLRILDSTVIFERQGCH
jgi:hypothetical protein